MPLVIAGSALALGAYLAIKGTYLVARGAFLLGLEAHATLKRHQEEKRQQRLAELEAEWAVREQALQAQQQLIAGQIQPVEQRLAPSRISHQVESAEAARAAAQCASAMDRLQRDVETLAEALAKEAKMNLVRMGNIREMWVVQSVVRELAAQCML